MVEPIYRYFALRVKPDNNLLTTMGLSMDSNYSRFKWEGVKSGRQVFPINNLIQQLHPCLPFREVIIFFCFDLRTI